jgi:hypothetical protein
MPDLETEDLKAALQYAARKLDHPVFAVQREACGDQSSLIQ